MEQLYLSRSNLTALLRKLDDEDSYKTIIKYRNENDPYVNTIDKIKVTAVEDEDLYINRERGLMVDELPFIAVGNGELTEKLGKTIICSRCGKRHKVEQDDEGHLQYIKCGEHLYLIGVDGYKINYKDKKKRGRN
jgi:hypothetical protein